MQSAERPQQSESRTGAPVELSGMVRRVAFRDESTGGAVLRVEPADQPGTIVTVRGATLAAEGDEVSISGVWTKHPKYGPQIKADRIVALRPSTPAAVERYLASGILPGIGEGLAKRIVARFGAETLDMLDADPERLLEVRGVGERKIGGIKAAWEQQKAAQSILLFLAGQGISPATAIRIYKQYGNHAIDVIRENPYRLAKEVRGIGFVTADAIARDLGVPPDSPQRIEAGLRHVVQEMTAKGHCGVPQDTAASKAAGLMALPPDSFAPVLDAMLASSEPDLVRDTIPPDVTCLFPIRLHRAERDIAKELLSLARRPSLWPGATQQDMTALVQQTERSAGVVLAEAQRAAVIRALSSRVSVLTGGPGTGKTSTLKILLAALHARRLRVKLAAPTGKAAKRMREATGYEAQTIARLIGMGTMSTPPIDCDMLIVDEASMVDVPMMQAVLAQLDDNAGLVLVGDVDQLPSVGPGRVLADIIDAGAVPVTRLTEVFRQAAQSAIVRNAHRINRGMALESEPPDGAPAKDFYFIPAETPAQIERWIVKLVTTHIPERIGISASDVQVLTPMRKFQTGTENLNRVLQAAENPNPTAYLDHGGQRFGVGDRVVQTKNNYDLGVMNGENGIIREIALDAGLIKIEVDARLVEYPIAELDEIELAYAMTVHRSQGSQFPAVVMPITTQHYMLLMRSIPYTAITRASRFCVVVGEPDALDMAIRNDRLEPRVTRLLACMLRHGAPP